ncbi:MAG: NADH-quinone oxidoreductase subunit NuoF [Clostridiales bacterium]|jgi:NADH-quinone oxidoreductase subunit F|nr:NADH-quinone oxidoreductase subunit NuoF [Clostridiales bacterium]
MKLMIGLGSCGIASGGLKIKEMFSAMARENPGINLVISETGCMGMCYMEPMVELIDDEGQGTVYGCVSPEMAKEIFEKHILGGAPVEDWVVMKRDGSGPEADFITKQQRIVLARCGRINPESLDEAIAMDAYKGLEKAIKSMTPAEVIDQVLASGLKGRGGAGFPTGLKWKFAAAPVADQKYIICNADEGDPGAFMDRSILEGDPHSVIEGLVIGGYAIGATEGYIYVRAEYPIAIKRLEIAIRQAEERGFLGNNILGSDYSFHLHIKQGAGAFVCGEETALLASIEGRRGMPRMRPPYPANKGLFGKPSNINNVETLANIGWIILNGAEKFAAIGTEKSKGTKVFALAGKVKNSGLVEIPIGASVKDVVFGIGGGTSSGKPFKAVQIGGPSGGCIPAGLSDTIIDYDTLAETGAIMGSGGMIVMDEDNCMVDIARYFLNFTQVESCGKCTFCKIGTKRMLEILERITKGQGEEDDIEKLELLADQIKRNSLCGLGQTAPNPVLTTLRYFRHEYEAHIKDKKCPAHLCKPLITYEIDEEKCTGCTVCARKCPVDAISGSLKSPHVIDGLKCIKCGICLSACKFDAISVD